MKAYMNGDGCVTTLCRAGGLVLLLCLPLWSSVAQGTARITTTTGER
ncbi:hypothetical protein QI600_004105 [Salmonella enterica]|nr:hypothetical protein [Salmonella enterica]